MFEIDKPTAYRKGYCEHCAAFFNYRILKSSTSEAEVKEKMKKSGRPRFMCGLTLPAEKKHLCTVAYRHPDVLDRWKKGCILKPGKYVELVGDVFNIVNGAKK